MKLPPVPEAVEWRNGMVLEPEHFQRTDERAAALSHLAVMAAEPWPWGFLAVAVDGVSLASSELRVDGEGFFPNGAPFRARQLATRLPTGNEGDRLDWQLLMEEDGRLTLSRGTAAASESLPVARLAFSRGVWTELPDWSPPAYVVGPEHPLREDMALQLGALAAIGAGFLATLRLPGADERPAARTLGTVAAALTQGVGIIEALLAAPVVSPARLGIEALRLALGVRGGAGIVEPLDERWDPDDQRGSMRRLLYAAESVASGIGLPFRASVFRPSPDGDFLVVEGMPPDTLLLAVETSRPADLIAARTWLEGAAIAAPERIEEAFTRRVTGCARRPIERDPRIGVSSGPLLALYEVEYNASWRGVGGTLALGSKTPAPNASFSVFVPDTGPVAAGPLRTAGSLPPPSWARSGPGAGNR